MQDDLPAALTFLCAMVIGPLAWMLLATQTSFRERPAYWLNGAMILVAAPMAFAMMRMGGYLMWATLPTVATLAAVLVNRLAGAQFDPVRLAVAAALMAPTVVAALPVAAMRVAPHKDVAGPISAPIGCFDGAAFADLAKLPPGLVVSATDIGPYVLAYTKSTTLAAPYHRAAFGIVAAYDLLAAPASGAQAGVAERTARELGVKYVVVCPAYDGQTGGPPFAAGSLQRALDAGHPPPWLKPLSSTAAAPLQVFSVDPGG
jgi:hypothetical protein